MASQVDNIYIYIYISICTIWISWQYKLIGSPFFFVGSKCNLKAHRKIQENYVWYVDAYVCDVILYFTK